MKIVIGIDVGISTTKIVGINEEGDVVSPIRIRATDPVTSLYGAFGKYLHDNHIQLHDVEKVMLTGVGSAYINEPVYGCRQTRLKNFSPMVWGLATKPISTVCSSSALALAHPL